MNAINLRSGVATTNIRDIKPQDFKATVYLQGKVAQLVPLLDGRINCNSTGTIWVLTNQAGLQLEDKVLIKGNIHYQSIP